MGQPQIVIQDWKGFHNQEKTSLERLEKGKTYRDLSTICIIPTRGVIPAKVVQNWWSLITPMNQKFIRMFAIGMEVGAAYSGMIEQIIVHPDLKKWKYILTLEEDNMPPPDGLLKLYESMDDYDAVGGLYWTKGLGGQPMCYGDPKTMPKNFIPQMPRAETVTPCNGLGMGFTLFKTEMFKDKKIQRPWFKTVQEFIPNQGTRTMTQDLEFFEKAGRIGYKFACDARVKVGHYDFENDTVW